MKKHYLTAVLGLLLVFIGTFAVAGDMAVMVEGAYINAVPPGQPNSAAYMTVNNHSGKDLALVGAKSTVAKVVELHTHLLKGGMMRMRKVEKIDMPVGKAAVLQPGGNHIMLIGLQQKLVPEENIEITLVFSDGSEKMITAPVKKLQMTMSMDDMKGGMKH